MARPRDGSASARSSSEGDISGVAGASAAGPRSEPQEGRPGAEDRDNISQEEDISRAHTLTFKAPWHVGGVATVLIWGEALPLRREMSLLPGPGAPRHLCWALLPHVHPSSIDISMCEGSGSESLISFLGEGCSRRV